MTGRIPHSPNSSSRLKPRAVSTTPRSLAREDEATEFASRLNSDKPATREAVGRKSKDRDGNEQPPSEQHDRKPGNEATHHREFPPAECILGNMVAKMHAIALPEAVRQPDVSVADGAFDLNSVAQRVAEEITVTDLSGTREVSIKLKDSLLPDTEIRLVQEEGRMRVRFVTSSSQSRELLSQHQQALQTTLNQKLPGRDFVVSIAGGSQLHQEQRDGQSRGRHEQPQEPNADDERIE